MSAKSFRTQKDLILDLLILGVRPGDSVSPNIGTKLVVVKQNISTLRYFFSIAKYQ